MADDDLKETIVDAAKGLLKSAGDNVSAESHPLPDLIAADRHLSSKAATKRKGFPLRMAKIEPPGTI